VVVSLRVKRAVVVRGRDDCWGGGGLLGGEGVGEIRGRMGRRRVLGREESVREGRVGRRRC
jgi:hypothetical protein